LLLRKRLSLKPRRKLLRRSNLRRKLPKKKKPLLSLWKRKMET
jgi:hypothetical protein